MADEAASPAKDAGTFEELDINYILDIPFKVTVELGSTSMSVKTLLDLDTGSIVELEKLAGEPLEVFINKKLVARGEAIVANEKFGIRITEIVSPIARLRAMQ